MNPKTLTAYFQEQHLMMMAVLRNLVEQESPSTDKPQLDRLAKHLRERFQGAGAEVTALENTTGGDHMRVVFKTDIASSANPPALIIGHYDTVWPVGALADHPFRIADGKAFGPGIFDMKASIVLAEFALRAVEALHLKLPRPVIILLTSDEEIGSPTSRGLIEEHAQQAEYVLVIEPPLPGGVLKTARKGIGYFLMELEGRAAHAGIEPEKGVSAINELAHQILYLQGLNDPSHGSTVNVGIVRGGTRPNVIAAHAEAEVDVRVWTTAEAERLERTILSAKPQTEETTLTVEGGFKRPPMERTPAIAALFQQAQQVGAELGLTLQEGATGGGSDGNFTAALGIPTLDGLGVEGAGAHADHEHILVDSVPSRAALLTALIQQL
jgi:glutamate carboxypeptidase